MRLHEWLQYRAINVISLLRTPCRVVDYIKPDLDHIRAQLPVSLYSASESGDGCHGPSYKKIWGLTSLTHVLHLPLRGPLVFSAIWDVSEPSIHAASQGAASWNPHEYWGF